MIRTEEVPTTSNQLPQSVPRTKSQKPKSSKRTQRPDPNPVNLWPVGVRGARAQDGWIFVRIYLLYYSWGFTSHDFAQKGGLLLNFQWIEYSTVFIIIYLHEFSYGPYFIKISVA